ncbi:MAG: FAD-dependent oxidoreductase [Mesorhizobium sp.]|nr:MAG: FAD-dependent oxidoreductase [Mesorhizobium sp.]
MPCPVVCIRAVVAILAFLAFGKGVKDASAQEISGKSAIVIYGCTVAGVAAAVAIRSLDRSATMVCPQDHIGGMTVSGLSWTDFGDVSTLGGVAAEFYSRIKEHYDDYSAWAKHDPRYYSGWRRGERYMIAFEPHVAEAILNKMVVESGAEVVHAALLEDESAVEKEGARIAAIRLTNGSRIAGEVFLDVTYEGDLAARAGASYVVGRESRDQYGEDRNGMLASHFALSVNGYVVEGDPSSGLLPGLILRGELREGEADHRVQAYNFRLCLTRDPDIRVAITKPGDYNPLEYELLARHIRASDPDAFYEEVFDKFEPLPNNKTDKNNSAPISTDFIGRNYQYQEGSYAERRKIYQEHRSYTQGFFWFLSNDSRVPLKVRQRMSQYGLCRDEFTSNDNWPYQLYIREARRLVGESTMTQSHVLHKESINDSIALGSYKLDSHNVSRFVDENGSVHNEGAFFVLVPRPYPISYRAITPKRDEVSNLLVPVALSATHAAYGSIRMEPVFMMLGQSAGMAAVLALEQGVTVQDVPYDDLKMALLNSGQVLETPSFYEYAVDRLRNNPKWVLLVIVVGLSSLLFGFSVGRFVRYSRPPKRLRDKGSEGWP